MKGMEAQLLQHLQGRVNEHHPMQRRTLFVSQTGAVENSLILSFEIPTRRAQICANQRLRKERDGVAEALHHRHARQVHAEELKR